MSRHTPERNARRRERYAADPAYRQKVKDYDKARRSRLRRKLDPHCLTSAWQCEPDGTRTRLHGDIGCLT